MTTAATVTFIVSTTRLPIALIICSMNLAAILASIRWHFIASGRHCLQEIVSTWHVLEWILELAIVNFRSYSTWTEGIFYQLMTSHLSIRPKLATALARTLIIRLTCHTLAAIQQAVCIAWLAWVVTFWQLHWRMKFNRCLADLWCKTCWGSISFGMAFVLSLICKSILFFVFLGWNWLLRHDHMIVCFGGFTLWDVDAWVIFFGYFWSKWAVQRLCRSYV